MNQSSQNATKVMNDAQDLQAHETLLEIDLEALRANYQYLRSKIKSQTKFLAVVKAYAYGSDARAVAKTLEACGADYLAVAYTNEGEWLRPSTTLPILVLHPVPLNFEGIVLQNLEPSLYSNKILNEFIAFAEEKGLQNYPIHLKINTGLNRLGFEADKIPFILKVLSETTAVKVASIFSHLAASEDLKASDFMHAQISEFDAISKTLISGLGYTPMLHCSNTSGIINYPEAHYDMVRSGIGLYGFANDPVENQYLQPIATLKTIISQIHTIAKGQSVGYNKGYIASGPICSATLPIGHADGIPRAYGKGKGHVFINGKRAPIIGNVCMDMLMVDITEIDCEEGDEVIIFGKEQTAEGFATSIGTISYELLTAISQRIPRKILNS